MSKSIADQITLAQQAANGDAIARQDVNRLIHPIIRYQTARFCKRFCFENRYRFACTLANPIGASAVDALLCEWGNASYGWMLNDLSGSKRLLKYQAKFDSSLHNYIYSIANSLAFYERWKDWRFDGNVHVPTYIRQLHANAATVFHGLRTQDAIELIAQKLMCSELEVQQLSREIIKILTKKKRLHLLNPPTTVSLTELNAGHTNELTTDDGYGEMDVAVYDESPEQRDDKAKLHTAWSKLSPVEQYVLEALIIEQQDAEDVLHALSQLNITIKQGVTAQKTNRQQLYYFRRKTIVKLNELMKNG